MENKRYYYLKLKENFFETDEMKLLEGMENGYLYSNILLKLYLKALKNNGRLLFDDYIPYNVKMIAIITGHNVDVVEKALKIFQSLKLLEVLDDGTIYMLNIQRFIGSISDEGLRKQKYREVLEWDKNGTMSQNCPNGSHIYNSEVNSLTTNDYIQEKIISNIKVVSNEKVISNKQEKETSKEINKKFIKPTIEQVSLYCKERNNNVNPQSFIDFYESKGWKIGKTPMKDWKAAVRTWEHNSRSNKPETEKHVDVSKYDR